jgi:hypothetical protein
MGFRFRRTMSLLPGIRVNISRSGVSTSIGTRGAWFTIGPKGTRTTVGIPGTGISYTSTSSSDPSQQTVGAPQTSGKWQRIAFGLLLLAIAVAFVARLLR